MDCGSLNSTLESDEEGEEGTDRRDVVGQGTRVYLHPRQRLLEGLGFLGRNRPP